MARVAPGFLPSPNLRRPDRCFPRHFLTIAGRSYRSRLLTGTGKFRDLEETRLATEAAGAEVVTVAIRRTNTARIGQPNLLDAAALRYTICRTPRCYSADDAVRAPCSLRANCSTATAWWSKVLGDRDAVPDVVETLKAAEPRRRRFRRHGLH